MVYHNQQRRAHTSIVVGRCQKLRRLLKLGVFCTSGALPIYRAILVVE